jgi:hypothetical protein
MDTPPSKKLILFTGILPVFKEQSACFFLATIKRALTDAEIGLADDTLREYMSEAMASDCLLKLPVQWVRL